MAEEKIAGHKIPKWQVPDDDMEDIVGNIKEAGEKGSPMQQDLDRKQEADKTRAMAGVCNKCRQMNCMCNEGQK